MYTSSTLSFSKEVIMRMFDDAVRDIASIRLPRWGRVVSAEGAVPWLVVDPGSVPVEPIRRYLVDFIARDNRPGSVRSYAYALPRWWRWRHAVGVEWNQATPAEARDLVLWLKQAAKIRQSKRTKSAATAGTINPVTRKRHLSDLYTPNTIRHSNAVVRAFYEFWIEAGEGPLINPVQLARRGQRANAHHNPLEPFRAEGRLRYNPRVPKAKPREMPEQRWRDLFAGLQSGPGDLGHRGQQRRSRVRTARGPVGGPGLGRPASARGPQGFSGPAVASDQPGRLRVAAVLPRRARRPAPAR
jgi:integrase/recombinase XerD